MEITPLEEWMSQGLGGGVPLSRERIEAHQLRKLRETMGWALARSAFYKDRLAGTAGEGLLQLGDLARLPFTTADDIRKNPLRFLCVSQSEVSRVVTLQTSGTTGSPKRIFFTEEDQRLTVDFFHHGMSTLVAPGDRVLILLPGERPGSVGDLLAQGLDRLGAAGAPHGPVQDAMHTLHVMEREKIDALVGIPVQVLSLARYGRGRAAPRSVLLSTDHVPGAITRELRRTWGCEVFSHYGMTEMGFGGGVECQAHTGYHLRESDLYIEIIHPDSGRPVEDGETGEIVFTTLTRRGMPLIRYRTGDLGRFIPGPCPCGTVLKTLAHIKGRVDNQVHLAPGIVLTMADLDEALFPIAGLLDFAVEISRETGCVWLRIKVQTMGEDATPRIIEEARRILDAHPLLLAARKAGGLKGLEVTGQQGPGFVTDGSAKRTFLDCGGFPRISGGISKHGASHSGACNGAL